MQNKQQKIQELLDLIQASPSAAEERDNEAYIGKQVLEKMKLITPESKFAELDAIIQEALREEELGWAGYMALSGLRIALPL